MPIFTYECLECDIISEKLVNSSDIEVTCESCGNKLSKKMSKPSVLLDRGERLANKVSTPTESQGSGVTQRFAHVVDRNTGQELGYVPAGGPVIQ